MDFYVVLLTLDKITLIMMILVLNIKMNQIICLKLLIPMKMDNENTSMNILYILQVNIIILLLGTWFDIIGN
jgi:hypothetical protein